jgi:hypothetical protein
MLSENQFMNIKNIYILFTNVSDSASIWIQELHINDTIETHKEKLTIIMNLITNMNEMIDGDLDDILLIVEENLKEYILDKFAKDSLNDTISESESESEKKENNYN